MLSIQQMNYILVLSEERHFQRASEKCFVTQPTLSMQIKKAEESLDAQIFDRSRNPLELTQFGVALIPIIRDVLNEYERVNELYNKRKGIFKEEVRIGIIPTIASYMLPDLYANWQSDLNDAHVVIEELKTDEILKALELKKIDIGILAGPHLDPKLRTTTLYLEEIKLYYPSGKTTEIKADDLGGVHPWLLTSGNCLRTQMMNFCELKDSSSSEWDYEGGNIELLQRMVELHGGYTLIPENCEVAKPNALRRIVSSTGEVPVREIIALTPNKSNKWGQLEKLIRSMQLKYAKKKQAQSIQVLNWS